ncbi:hypothetical protein SAMN05421867_103200 [Cellulomonas marina]|uniref:Uncharacterized protein n=1 Tax=Cellulomonas marina TaxID=988821 RepID=A0A1I0WS47_9CELL|nr:hypothetical protein SAMN05421867_103200 [Cellulomonas marina]
MLVLGGLLALVDGYAAFIGTASFLGSTPTPQDALRASATCLTGLLALAAMAVLALLHGSRWGLVLLALPAAVLLAFGGGLPGVHVVNAPPGGPGLDALKGEGTGLNWTVTVLALAGVGATLLVRRRRRTRDRPPGGRR